MTLPVDVRRPPKPNYFITVAGSRIGVERRDLSARDVLQARIDFTIALTYARFYIRSMHPVAIKDVFTDDDGNDWRVRGVSRYGRGWNEVIAQTTSLDPTPAPPMPPLPPGEPDYRFDTAQGWLAELKRRCEARGALLIVDEAQTGLAKLGMMWGFEQEQVVPDIFTISKHFGGGVAISAAITTDEIEEKASETGLVVGHSHSNDPLPCHAAIASIDIILEEMLTDVAQRIGAYWRDHLDRLASRHEIIGDIRGRGLLQGIELVADRQSREPAYAQGREIGRRCLENGLILSVRRSGSVFRFVPPFTTTEAQMDEAAEILDEAIVSVYA